MKGIGISVDTSCGDVNLVAVRRAILRNNSFADNRSCYAQLLFNPLCFALVLLDTQTHTYIYLK